MNEQIKQIATRIRDLREVLELSREDVAKQCNISLTVYEKFENGDEDIPVSFLIQMAEHYGVPVYTLLAGEDLHVGSYFVTRKESGITIAHSKVHTHQYLAGGFKEAKTAPYIVTIKKHNVSVPLNIHTKQEFNLVLKGTLLLQIDSKEIILKQGDSIYFGAKYHHGIKALTKRGAVFLTILL